MEIPQLRLAVISTAFKLSRQAGHPSDFLITLEEAEGVSGSFWAVHTPKETNKTQTHWVALNGKIISEGGW